MPNFRPPSPIAKSQSDNYTNFNLGWDADDDADDDNDDADDDNDDDNDDDD